MTRTARCLVIGAVALCGLGAPAVATPQPTAQEAEAAYQRGLAYARSNPPEYFNAVIWYSRAAELGHPAAQNDLGRAYHYGLGVPRDYAEAMRRYRLAAAQGGGLAQNNLGVLYRDGLGVPKDLDQAVAWFRKAVAAGEPLASQNLATLGARQRGMAPWLDVLEGKSLMVAITRRGLVYLFATVPVRLPSGHAIDVKVPIKVFTDQELRELGVMRPDGTISMTDKPHLPYKPLRAVTDAQRERFVQDHAETAITIHYPPYVVVADGLDTQPAGTREVIRGAIETLYER